jgi:hypothetical protein
MIRLPNGKLTIARGPDGAPVGVLDVPRGRACGCVCPECGQALVARVGPDRAPHFSHAPSSSPCTGMGAWHAMVRDVICRLEHIDLGRSPPVPRLAGVQRVLRGRRECAVFEQQFRPDGILETQAGLRIAVEVVDTHEVPALNLAAMLQEQFQVLRIDVGMVRKSIQGRPLGSELPKLLSRSGPWQSWPSFHEGAVQRELSLEHRSRWSRALRCLGGPPLAPLLSLRPCGLRHH